MLLPVFRRFSPLLVLTPGIAFADSGFSFANSVDVSGFIGVGGEYVDMLELELEESQSVIESGVRISAALPMNFVLNAQALMTERSGVPDDRPELDYATVDWQFSNFLGEQKFSLGRFKANGGIYSNTRDMPFTRPGIRLSDSIYGDGFRSIYKHIDGIRTDTTFDTEFGAFNLELGFGVHNADADLGSSVLGQPVADTTTYDADNSLLVNLRYETISLMANFTYRQLDVDTEVNLKQSPVNSVELGSYIGSLQYTLGDLEFTLESILQEVTLTDTYDVDTLFGYYFQTRYFVTPTITLLASFHESDNYNSNLEMTGAQKYRVTTSSAETYTLGVSWRPAEQWQLAAEVHHLEDNNTTTLAQLAWRF